MFTLLETSTCSTQITSCRKQTLAVYNFDSITSAPCWSQNLACVNSISSIYQFWIDRSQFRVSKFEACSFEILGTTDSFKRVMMESGTAPSAWRLWRSAVFFVCCLLWWFFLLPMLSKGNCFMFNCHMFDHFWANGLPGVLCLKMFQSLSMEPPSFTTSTSDGWGLIRNEPLYYRFSGQMP